MMRDLRTFLLATVVATAACSRRGPPSFSEIDAGLPQSMNLPEPALPLSYATLIGTWQLRRSFMRSAADSSRHHLYVMEPDAGNVEIFKAAGAYEEPSNSHRFGMYSVSRDSVVIAMTGGRTNPWFHVEVSRHWLRQTTDSSVADLGRGRELTLGTYLYERRQ